MKLKDCELTVGVVVSVEDETHSGRIKCIIPGIINNKISEKNSPWIRPLMMGGYQTFSKEMVGSKVWILINHNNYNEYWYFPFFELNNVAIVELAETYDNDQPEIFMSHDTGGNNAISMYDEKNGYRMMIGGHHIALAPDGHVSLVGNSGEVDINGSKVQIGAVGGAYEKAVLGEKLQSILSNLQTDMDKLAEDAGKNPYTSALIPGFQNASQHLEEAKNMLSTNVSLN